VSVRVYAARLQAGYDGSSGILCLAFKALDSFGDHEAEDALGLGDEDPIQGLVVGRARQSTTISVFVRSS
jgi:hypothetical protein